MQSLFGFSSGEFSEFSSKDKNFVSFEVSEILSALLSGKGLSEWALCEFLGNSFFADDSSNLSTTGTSSDLKNLLSELKSADGDDLALDAFSIDEDSLVVEDINDSGQLAFEGTVVNASDAADLNEFGIALNSQTLTILCGR